MKRVCLYSLLLSLFLLAGCTDRIDIEDISLSLLLGIDLDDENNLIISSSSPVFHKEAIEKQETTVVKAISIRQSRQEFDSTITALTSRGKVQVILIGKRVFEHEDWFNLLDTVYRDGRNPSLSTVVMVDGRVADIFSLKPKDKPRLPVYLMNLINSSLKVNITVKTSLQKLRRQYMDKGVTPSITAFKPDSDVKITGTALLDESGIYKMTLNPNQNMLLRILRHETDGLFTFTITLPDQHNKGLFHENRLSFYPEKISVKTKTDYVDDRFTFNVGVKMKIIVNERLFDFEDKNGIHELEQQIQDELKKNFELLIKKIQAAEIDPIGFGPFARAYEYAQWKKVQDDWGAALSKADVHVNVKVAINGMGTIK
ncbi:Ger(x)C family spore germination protein [Paenibacillus marinisediminis]